MNSRENSRPTTPLPLESGGETNGISNGMNRAGSRPTSGRSSRSSARSSSSHTRVQYQPRVDNNSQIITPRSGMKQNSEQNSDNESNSSNPFEKCQNFLLPLVKDYMYTNKSVFILIFQASAGGATAPFIDQIIENIIPKLTDQLKYEFDKEMGKLEDEHQKRLKDLHQHHQNEQFALYEKNVQLHEKISQLGLHVTHITLYDS